MKKETDVKPERMDYLEKGADLKYGHIIVIVLLIVLACIVIFFPAY